MKKALMVSLAAVLLFSLAACTKTQQGAVIGGAVGAGAGYAIGDANGDHGREGAVIGGVVGAVTGGVIGNELDEVKYCPQCGREYKAEDQFCSVDGTSLLMKQQ